MRKILLILTSSAVFSGTPLEYTITLTGGYDNNVLRFSKYEFDDAANNPKLMGDARFFDSFVTKWNIKAKKSFILSKNKNLAINLSYTNSSYNQTPEKQYWSSGLDIIYKWGSYKNLKYSLRHLDDFYLRYYVDRDISTQSLSPCLFTDRNQSLTLTHKFSRNVWANIGGGYLQRYYSVPFTEFDIDINYLKVKVNYKIRKLGTVALQVNHGDAVSESHFLPERPSSFDRSYKTTEWYSPLRMNRKIPFFNEIGISARVEDRVYAAEDPNDPLHAGRSHLDVKYDLWFKKRLNEVVGINFSSRYRTRTTESGYEWVKDLKSFSQFQFWFNIEWDLIYDKY